MLKWLRSIDWTAIGASGLFLAAAILLISVVSPKQETISAPNQHLDYITNPTSADERLADYTLGLEVFTGALVIIGAFEIWLLFRTDDTAKFAARATIRQVVIARRQMTILGQQADILIEQKQIARAQHLAEHRPRLSVRHVTVIDRGAAFGQPTFFFSNGSTVQGGLAIVNSGGTRLKIIESFYKIHCSKDGLPVESPLDAPEARDNLLLVPGTWIGIGESVATAIPDKIFLGKNPDPDSIRLREFAEDGWEMYVMGQIRYADEGGNERFMGFCRKRDAAGKFLAVNDPDYEFQD
jgi:hypothetical protein